MPRMLLLSKNLLLVHNLEVAVAVRHMLGRPGQHILDSRYFDWQGQEKDGSGTPVVAADTPDFAVAFVAAAAAAAAAAAVVVVDILGSVGTLHVGSSCPAEE